MGQQFIFVGPAHQVVAQHLVRALGRLAAGPEVDQQTGDDRAVRLNLDPVRVMAQQMPSAQQVLERAEEDLDLPAVFVDQRDDFGGDVQQVGHDPQQAVAVHAGGAAA